MTELLIDDAIDKKTAWKELRSIDDILDERIELEGYNKNGKKVRKKLHESFLYR